MLSLLDTDTLSNLVKRRASPHLVERLSREPKAALYTSVVNVYELRMGCRRRPAGGEQLWDRIESEVLSRVNILSFELKHALGAGDLLAHLMNRGDPISVEDALIAAIALVEGARIVTGNVRHFGRIPGLTVENWMEESARP